MTKRSRQIIAFLPAIIMILMAAILANCEDAAASVARKLESSIDDLTDWIGPNENNRTSAPPRQR